MRFLKAQTTSRGINSDTKGFNIDSLGLANINTDKAVIVPKGTQNQRPYTGVEGMLRYNSELDEFEGYAASAWGSIGGGASAGGAVYENAQTIAADYTMTTGTNGHSVGPITVDSGVTVTIPSGSSWLVSI